MATPLPRDAAVRQFQALSPDARHALLAKMRSTRLAPWISRHVPQHTPVPPHLRPLIAALERAVNGPTRLLLSMPPRHAKTVTVLAGLAWCIDRYRHKLNGYVTYAGKRAASKARQCRSLVQSAGVVLDEGATAVHDWRTPEGGGLLSAGIGGPLTGEGISGLLVVDDPFKGRAEAESPVMRENVWEWFNDVAYTRLNHGASCIVVATRWHHDDLIGRLAQMGTVEDPTPWEVINIPAIRDRPEFEGCLPADEGYALWPEQFSLADLRAIRRQILEYSWASLYQGHPVPRGGAVFAEPHRYIGKPPDGGRVVCAVDPAGSAKTKANHTCAVALWVTGRGDQMTARVLDVDSFQLEAPEAAERLYKFQHTWGKRGFAYEATRDGEAQARALKLIDPRLKLLGIKPMGDKLTRAGPVAAAWNDGRVLVPMKGAWVGDFLHVIAKFTGLGDPRDDEVDALAHAWNLAAGTAAIVGASIKTVGTSRFGANADDLVGRSRERARGLFG